MNEEAQALARESSLVCRENAKLRAQLAELQAAREDDSSAFRATIASHPTSHDLAQVDAALTKSEAWQAELEQALALARDAITSLQGRLAAQEAGQVAQAAEASIKYSEAERELRAEMCALSAELAAARGDAQDKHARSAAAEAERAAAAEASARRQTGTHAERVASLQAELHEARELLIALQGEQATGGADAATLRVALARAEAEAAEGRRQAAAAAVAAEQAARAAAEAAEAERRTAAEALQELLREAKRSLLAARQDAKDGRAREQAAAEAATQAAKEAATEAATEAARRGAAEVGRLKREAEAERGRANASEARGTELEP